jgi:hypothetical protein
MVMEAGTTVSPIPNPKKKKAKISPMIQTPIPEALFVASIPALLCSPNQARISVTLNKVKRPYRCTNTALRAHDRVTLKSAP